MTAFQQKLQTARKAHPNVNVYTPEYKQQIWTLLIACGGATKCQDPEDERYNSWHNDRWGSYYGSVIDLDYDLTCLYAPLIREYGIDWAACDDPAEHTENRFNGTFTDTQLTVRFFAGRLVLNNGESLYWGCMYEGEDFGSLIRTITKLSVSWDDALEELEERLSDPAIEKYSSFHFDYMSKLPEL